MPRFKIEPPVTEPEPAALTRVECGLPLMSLVITACNWLPARNAITFADMTWLALMSGDDDEMAAAVPGQSLSVTKNVLPAEPVPRSVPKFTAVLPVYVFVPERINVPVPCLTSASVPVPFCTTPAKVRLGVASPTANVTLPEELVTVPP